MDSTNFHAFKNSGDGKFRCSPQTGSVTFPSAGTWYDYLNGTTITATGSAQSFTLAAGRIPCLFT